MKIVCDSLKKIIQVVQTVVLHQVFQARVEIIVLALRSLNITSHRLLNSQLSRCLLLLKIRDELP